MKKKTVVLFIVLLPALLFAASYISTKKRITDNLFAELQDRNAGVAYFGAFLDTDVTPNNGALYGPVALSNGKSGFFTNAQSLYFWTQVEGDGNGWSAKGRAYGRLYINETNVAETGLVEDDGDLKADSYKYSLPQSAGNITKVVSAVYVYRDTVWGDKNKGDSSEADYFEFDHDAPMTPSLILSLQPDEYKNWYHNENTPNIYFYSNHEWPLNFSVASTGDTGVGLDSAPYKAEFMDGAYSEIAFQSSNDFVYSPSDAAPDQPETIEITYIARDHLRNSSSGQVSLHLDQGPPILLPTDIYYSIEPIDSDAANTQFSNSYRVQIVTFPTDNPGGSGVYDGANSNMYMEVGEEFYANVIETTLGEKVPAVVVNGALPRIQFEQSTYTREGSDIAENCYIAEMIVQAGSPIPANLFVTDNVSNQSEAVPLDLNFPGFPLVEEAPEGFEPYISFEGVDATPYLNIALRLTNSYMDHTNGYKSLILSTPDEQIDLLSLPSGSTVDETPLDENISIYTFKMPLSSSIDSYDPHASIAVHGEFTLPNDASGGQSFVWFDNPAVSVENVALDNTNPVDISLYRNGREALFAGYAAGDLQFNSDTTETVYDNSELIIVIDTPSTAAGNQPVDVQGDKLSLVAWNDDSTAIVTGEMYEWLALFPDYQGEEKPDVYALRLAGDYAHVMLYESYDGQSFDPASYFGYENFLPFSVMMDQTLSPSFFSIKRIADSGGTEHTAIVPEPITDGSGVFQLSINQNLTPDKSLSGIESIRILDASYPGLVEVAGDAFILNKDLYETIKDGYPLGSAELTVDDFTSVGVVDAEGRADLSFAMPVVGGAESERLLALVFEDRAGNIQSQIEQVVIDDRDPSALVLGSGNLVSVESVATSNGLYYGFTASTDAGVTGEITLQFASEARDQSNIAFLRLPLLDLLDKANVELINAPSGIMQPDIWFDEVSNQIKITVPDMSEFLPNDEIRLALTFSDPVGNSTTQEISLYTPSYFYNTQANYILIPQTDSWMYSDVEAGYHPVFHWSADSPDGIAVLTDISGDTERLLVGLEDTEVTPHQSKSYRLNLKNLSGYVSDYPGAGYEFSRQAANYIPRIISMDHQVVYQGDTLVMGWNTVVNTDLLDYDNDQLKLLVYIDNEVQGEYPIAEGMSTTGLSSLLDLGSLGTGPFALSYGLRDEWTEGDAQMYGDEQVLFTGTVQFDLDGPELTTVTPVLDDGFFFSGGSYRVVLSDNLTEVTALQLLSIDGAPADGVSVTADSSVPGSYILSGIPDGYQQQISAQATDSIGNTSDLTVRNVSVDAHAPVIQSVQLSAVPLSGITYLGNSVLPLSLDWSDQGSGLSKIQVELSDDNGEMVYVHSLNRMWDSSGEGNASALFPTDEYPLDGVIYTGRVRIADGAGNFSEWTTLADKIVFDRSAPSVELAFDQANYRNGRYIITGAAVLTEKVTSDSPVASGGISIYDSNDQLIGSGIESVSDLLSSLPPGVGYYLIDTVTDAAGNTAYSAALPFIIDEAVPVLNGLTISNQDQLFPGGRLTFAVDARDSESAVDALKLWIGKNGDSSPSLSSQMTGADASGLISVSYLGASHQYTLYLPESASGDYEIRVAVIDAAGNDSGLLIGSGNSFSISDTATRFIVIDGKSYYNGTDSISARWIYSGSEIASFEYRLVQGNENSPVSAWVQTLGTSVSLTDTSMLSSGTKYKFEVKGTTTSGEEIASRYSDGFVLDDTDPVLLSSNIDAYSGGSSLGMNWVVSDVDSGIRSTTVELRAIARNDEGSIIYGENGPLVVVLKQQTFDFTALSFDGAVTIPAEQLAANNIQDGDQLFATMILEDMAGNTSSHSLGTAIVDRTSPSALQISDQGDFINPGKTPLIFTWLNHEIESQSPIVSAEYQLLSAATGATDGIWSAFDPSLQVLELQPGPLDNGTQVYLAIRLTSAAGHAQTFFSDGIMVDLTAPDIPYAYIADPVDEAQVNYVTSADYLLFVQSHDAQSGIAGFDYQKEVYRDGQWIALGDVLHSETSGGYIQIHETEEIPAGEIISYRVWSINHTEELSSQDYRTPSVIFDTRKPGISELSLVQNQDTLVTHWSTDGFPMGSDSLLLILTSANGELFRQSVNAGDGGFVFDSSNMGRELADGSYTLKAQPYGLNGAEGAISQVSLFADRSAPVLDDFIYDRYISTRLNFLVRGDDDRGIAGFRYRIGYAGDPAFFTGDWISLTGDFSQLDVIYGFAGDTGADGALLNHLDNVLVSVQMRDSRGNWSDVFSSDAILVDKTGPEISSITQNRDVSLLGFHWTNLGAYILSNQSVERMDFAGIDEESGIAGYRYAIVPESQIADDSIQWSSVIAVEDYPYFYVPTHLEVPELYTQSIMSGGENWKVFIQLVNRAGVFSATGESEIMEVDLSPAQIQMVNGVNGFIRETGSTGAERPVYNTDSNVRFEVASEQGEQIVVSYQLRNPQGLVIDQGEFLQSVSNPEFSLPFTPSQFGDTPGVYSYLIIATDQGGRVTQMVSEVRYNAAPEINVADVLYSTPGRSIAFGTDDYIYDADGIGNITVDVYFDGELITSSSVASLDEWSETLGQSDQSVQQTDYQLIITAVDNLGQQSAATTMVTIRNTSEGTLYADEYWTGEHTMTGDIIVPEGITLHIAPDARVKVVIDPLGADPAPELLVRGTIEISDGVIFSQQSLTAPGYWRGLRIQGTAVLGAMTISGAERALSIEGTSATLEGLTLIDNRIGLHIINSTVNIASSSFLNNLWYGIKEDGAASVQVINSSFSGNGYDYYTIDGRLLTATELNNIPQNRGNN